MKQAAFIEFCRRWMERDLVIAERSGIKKDLATKAKEIRLREGLCNSNQGTGIFTDQYQRCAYIKDPSRSLLYMAVKALSDKHAKDNEYLIPISDSELAANILKVKNRLVNIDFHCTLGNDLYIGGKNLIYIRAQLQASNDHDDQSQHLFNLLKLIANWGALATQDTLIQILLALNPDNVLNDDKQYLDIVNDNLNLNTFDALKLLRQASASTTLEANDAKSYAFYCRFLERLILGFQDTMQYHSGTISLESKLLCMQAIRRLYLKLLVVQDQDSNYQTCMTSIEFAFDEIANLLSIIKPYSKNDLFNSIKSLASNNLQLTDEMPTAVSLAGSCMQIIHRKIMSSLKYLVAGTDSKEVNIYITSDMYYEVSKAREIDQDFEHHKLVTYRGLIPQSVQNYDGQIVDLMLLNFHANVNRRKKGFASHDLKSMIENQFKLRTGNNSAKQLIVILDGTMTNLSGDHVRKLLEYFKDQIRSGELAFTVLTSLNKYLHSGFDRFPSAISIDFYNQEHFPGLSIQELVGFDASDAIPQTVTHFFRNVGDSLSSYYRMVHEFSRHLHDNIIPQDLYMDNQPIQIDNPYTQDAYHNPWGFMVIRFADERITALYKPKLHNFLSGIGIDYRDGFGFNKSTYSSIGANLEILRISIGPNSSEELFRQIVSFIELQNSNICKTSAKMRARGG